MRSALLALNVAVAGAVCSPCYEKPPACTGSETSVQITGVAGDFCSPLCVQNECPKGDGSFTAKPSCVLETQGSSKPTQCALICTPGSNGECPTGSTCQAIQGEGICTYPSSTSEAKTSAFFVSAAPVLVGMEQGAATVESAEWTRVAAKPSPDERIVVRIMMRHEASDVAQLEATLYAVSDPASPRYGKHLQNEEVAAMTPISAAKTNAVRAFLAKGGATIEGVVPNGDILRASMSVAQAERLFATEMATFTSASRPGLTLTRAAKAYSVPADVAAAMYVVGDLVGLPASSMLAKKIVAPSSGDDGEASAPSAAAWPAGCPSLATCATYVTPAVVKQRYTVTDDAEDFAANAMASMAVAEFQGQEWDPTDLAKFSTACSVNVTVDKTVGANSPATCSGNPNACVSCAGAALFSLLSSLFSLLSSLFSLLSSLFSLLSSLSPPSPAPLSLGRGPPSVLSRPPPLHLCTSSTRPQNKTTPI
jgi:hypothetical protein